MNLKKEYQLFRQSVLADSTKEEQYLSDMKVWGNVIPGNKLGRTVGFPTANIEVDEIVYNWLSPDGLAYDDRRNNALDFHLIGDVKVGDNMYKGFLIVEFQYNWLALKQSLAQGYNPEEHDSYIVVREEQDGFHISDGNHRHKVLMDLQPDENIDVKTEDGDILSIKPKDIKMHNPNVTVENKISVHIFDFSEDIYGQEIEVFPKSKSSEKTMKHLINISSFMK